jgi:hypothetical protein
VCLCRWLPLLSSGPPPPEVTPTALIIFCFAPGLFSTTNFQQSPWRRAGARGGRGYGNPRPERPSGPLLTCPGLWVPQAGWEIALSHAAVRNRVRGPGASPACSFRGRQLLKPGNQGTTQHSLDPATKPRRLRLAGGRDADTHDPLHTHTHTHTHTHDKTVWCETSVPCSPSWQTGSLDWRRQLLPQAKPGRRWSRPRSSALRSTLCPEGREPKPLDVPPRGPQSQAGPCTEP